MSDTAREQAKRLVQRHTYTTNACPGCQGTGKVGEPRVMVRTANLLTWGLEEVNAILDSADSVRYHTWLGGASVTATAFGRVFTFELIDPHPGDVDGGDAR